MKNPYERYIQQQSAQASTENPYAKYMEKMGRAEALGRGAYYGGFQQPRDVIAAAYANLFAGVPFKDALEMAKENSLEGKQGVAQEQQPGWFGGGQITGNIAASLIPAGVATKAIGAAAPILENAPIAGRALSGLAKGIGANKGFVGVPAAGAVQGAASSLTTEGDLSGAIPGAIGGSIVGGVGKIARPIAESAISKARQGYTDLLQNIGINNLTPGQLTGNKFLQTVDAVGENMFTTAGKAREIKEDQLRKFTNAVIEKTGIDSNTFNTTTREGLESIFDRKFDALYNGKQIKLNEPEIRRQIKNFSNEANAELDQASLDIVNKAVNQVMPYTRKVPNNTEPTIKEMISKPKLIDWKPEPEPLNSGYMPGEKYQAVRKAMTLNARSMENQLGAEKLRELRNYLDEVAQPYLSNAENITLQKTNNEYRNFKDLQKAVSSLSQDALEGIVPPAALARAVEVANKTKGTKGYGELYDLSRAGKAVLGDVIPNSGTAQRVAAQNLLTMGIGAGGLGGATYGYTKDPELALGAAAGAFGLPKLTQALLNSPAGRTYFTQGIPGLRNLSKPGAKKLAALMGAQMENE